MSVTAPPGKPAKSVVRVGDRVFAGTARIAALVIMLALAVSKPVEGRPSVDMAYDIDRTTTESGAYPVLLTSYLIACQHYADAKEADLVKGFLSYIVSDAGQQAAAQQAGSAPLDSETASKAADLGQAAIKVGSTYNKPSAEGAAKVLAMSPREKGRGPNDMAIAVDRTTTESGAYPLMLTSYLIACPTYDNANDAALVKGLLSYVVSDQGQQAAAQQAGSAPLDSQLAAQAKSIIDKISGK